MSFREKWRRWWQLAQILFYRWFGRKYRCGCGHVTKWMYVLRVEGRASLYRLDQVYPHWCSECLKKFVIRCPWCGKLILPGEPISLRPFVKGLPTFARLHIEGSTTRVVGCCCGEGALDRAGFWEAPGVVRRVMTPEEQLRAAIIAGDEEPVIIINDVTDPAQAFTLHKETPDSEH